MASCRTLFPYLALVLLLFSFSEARDFLVGGQENSWKIPSTSDEFNKWAEKIRFQIGDYLVLKYNPNSDSVLEVSEEDYNSCNKAQPIKVYHDGNTKVQLDRSGPFFFISGAQGHCEKGQKLEVKVLAAKHGSGDQSPAPEPSPAEFHALATAPSSSGGHFLSGGSGILFGGLVGLALTLA